MMMAVVVVMVVVVPGGVTHEAANGPSVKCGGGGAVPLTRVCAN